MEKTHFLLHQYPYTIPVPQHTAPEHFNYPDFYFHFISNHAIPFFIL